MFHESTQSDKVGASFGRQHLNGSRARQLMVFILLKALYNRLVPLSGGERKFSPIQINRLKVEQQDMSLTLKALNCL